MAGKNNKPINLDYGRVPPQVIAYEESILARCIMYPNDLLQATQILDNADYFYKQDHQLIWSSLTAMSEEGVPIDLLTLTQRLTDNGTIDEVGGPFAVTQITNRVCANSHTALKVQCEEVKARFILRDGINFANNLTNKAFEGGYMMDSYMSDMQAHILKTSKLVYGGATVSKEMADIVDRCEKELIQRTKNAKDGNANGVPTGSDAMDQITDGWRRGDLIVLAGRPSMGKTAVVLHMIAEATRQKFYVDVFSLEMKSERLVDRIIVGKSGVNAQRFKTGKLEAHEWEKVATTMTYLKDNTHLRVDDESEQTLAKIRAKCSLRKAEDKLGMVVIDYLQLVDTDGDAKNREREVALLSRGLKLMAKDLDVPVILLAQLNRGVEQRTGDAKVPMLSDLRESGAIEQDADMVIFIHRPERYGILEDAEGNSLRNIIQLIIAKYRDGQVGEVVLRHNGTMTHMYDVDDYDDNDDKSVVRNSMERMLEPESRILDSEGLDGAGFDFNAAAKSSGDDDDDVPF